MDDEIEDDFTHYFNATGRLSREVSRLTDALSDIAQFKCRNRKRDPRDEDGEYYDCIEQRLPDRCESCVAREVLTPSAAPKEPETRRFTPEEKAGYRAMIAERFTPAQEGAKSEEAIRADEREAIAKWLENQTWREIPSDPSALAMEIRALSRATQPSEK